LPGGTFCDEVDVSNAQPLIIDEHETPILRDFNTITRGFIVGGLTNSSKKRYSRTILSMEKRRKSPTPIISFSNVDLEDITPHEDDPIVLSIAIMGKNVHRVLIYQESSINVMFCNTFVKFQVLRDQLKSFDDMLVGFSREQIEVQRYVNLRTTFTYSHAVSTIAIKYIVVNTRSSYNLLYERPSLNKLGLVVSLVHLKIKFSFLWNWK